MACIHCGRTGHLVSPEDHDKEYDETICEHPDCQKYQVASGLELLGNRLI